MKSIKSFKHLNEISFKDFLKSYGYSEKDVKGFALGYQKQYHGNVLKVYNIHFNDGEMEYFKVANFKDFNEYHQSSLGFKGNKLLGWWENANAKTYRVCDEIILCK